LGKFSALQQCCVQTNQFCLVLWDNAWLDVQETSVGLLVTATRDFGVKQKWSKMRGVGTTIEQGNGKWSKCAPEGKILGGTGSEVFILKVIALEQVCSLAECSLTLEMCHNRCSSSDAVNAIDQEDIDSAAQEEAGKSQDVSSPEDDHLCAFGAPRLTSQHHLSL